MYNKAHEDSTGRALDHDVPAACINVFNVVVKHSKLYISWTLVRADRPNVRNCERSWQRLNMAFAKAFHDTIEKIVKGTWYPVLTCGVFATSKPVLPDSTVSHGPPLSHDITGRPAAIASNGVIPKCSLIGVYRSAMQLCNSLIFVPSLSEGKKRVSFATPSEWANLVDVNIKL